MPLTRECIILPEERNKQPGRVGDSDIGGRADRDSLGEGGGDGGLGLGRVDVEALGGGRADVVVVVLGHDGGGGDEEVHKGEKEGAAHCTLEKEDLTRE